MKVQVLFEVYSEKKIFFISLLIPTSTVYSAHQELWLLYSPQKHNTTLEQYYIWFYIWLWFLKMLNIFSAFSRYWERYFLLSLTFNQYFLFDFFKVIIHIGSIINQIVHSKQKQWYVAPYSYDRSLDRIPGVHGVINATSMS